MGAIIWQSQVVAPVAAIPDANPARCAAVVARMCQPAHATSDLRSMPPQQEDRCRMGRAGTSDPSNAAVRCDWCTQARAPAPSRQCKWWGSMSRARRPHQCRPRCCMMLGMLTTLPARRRSSSSLRPSRCSCWDAPSCVAWVQDRQGCSEKQRRAGAYCTADTYPWPPRCRPQSKAVGDAAPPGRVS